MIRRLYDWVLSLAAHRNALPALGVISFVESSVFPIPADVIFIPMCATRPNQAMRYAFVATVTSVLGGIFGWLLGHYAYEALALPVLEFYHKAEAFETLRAEVAGSFGFILILLVTSGLAHLPPMKVVTILAGVIGFSLPLFVLSAIVARGARFYALAWLLRLYGPQVLAFIERRMVVIASAVVALAIFMWLILRFQP